MSQEERVCALDLRDRGNLDPEMTAIVKGAEKKYGFMPNFMKVFSTDNQRLRAFMVPYLELTRSDSGVTSEEREMIALVCAATHGCNYCKAHHSALVRGETGDPALAEQLVRDYRQAPLTPRQRAMLDYVVKVLKEAEHIDDADRQSLRDVGFDDEGIWMVTSIACFYAGANRMAQALKIVPSPEYEHMYREPKTVRKTG
jgi:uncharacterized peroxidase-related enzyme